MSEPMPIRAVVVLEADRSEISVFTEGQRIMVRFMDLSDTDPDSCDEYELPSGEVERAWVSSDELSQHSPEFVNRVMGEPMTPEEWQSLNPEGDQ